MAVAVAGGVGARHGLILKTAETINEARKVSHVIFDKTGTLTQGTPCVVKEDLLKLPSSHELTIILGIAATSNHPIATAVAFHLRSLGIEPSNHPSHRLDSWKRNFRNLERLECKSRQSILAGSAKRSSSPQGYRLWPLLVLCYGKRETRRSLRSPRQSPS